MKPSFEQLKAASAGVEDALIREHLARLDDRYFEGFATAQIAAHVAGLSRLSPAKPVEALVNARRDGITECTVLAFDYPAEFSLIAGVLSSMGMDISSGDIFTYGRSGPADVAPRGGRRAGHGAGDPLRRRRIIDHFVGSAPSGREDWASELRRRLRDVIGLLEQGDADAVGDARRKVNEMVAARLADLRIDSYSVLYPVHIEVDNSGEATCMKVVSEDTPFFLYALSAALSLHDVSIERVSIRTVQRRIEDEFYFVGLDGARITDADKLNQIKFSVLLTKQFTYFLSQAPEPYAALCRFETLVADILRLPQQGRWFDMLSNPRILQDLARLLGASDFLWEDFIRLQYETLLPMLGPNVEQRSFATPSERIGERLRQALEGARGIEEQARRLNEFKDREVFLIDLEHILSPGIEMRVQSERLTALADAVLNEAFRIVYADLVERHGRPTTVAGLDARYTLMGLGKLGGVALGYASDLELLLIYSDNGRTSGVQSIGNAEFFEKLAREGAHLIRAKREGIFHVDLRLRPFGNDGPLACSLESFCRYYGKGGQAHSYERLALVRLRVIGGDGPLGRRVERLRDEMTYASAGVDLAEIRDLRGKQIQEFTVGGRLNAKYSPGALVDLEYTVQTLQVMHGKDRPQLRTPRIHEALESLARASVLEAGEAQRLSQAYYFLRRLINGLRMLRGNARDLFLPPVDSDEYAHLARRMGYEPGGGSSPARQLHVAFETSTAEVRAFVERHLGRASLPGPAVGNVADLVLLDETPEPLRDRVLAAAGFRNVRRAYVNLRALAGRGRRRGLFAELAVLACDILRARPDPDMALNNWERFCGSLRDVEGHFQNLLSQPMRLELLMSLFAASHFLADTLVRDPDFLDWATAPDKVRRARRRDDLLRELDEMSRGEPDEAAWRNGLRRFRRRETLRIGARDLCLGVDTREVVGELSALAEALVQSVLDRAWQRMESGLVSPQAAYGLSQSFCIMALGKLGGGELNYSSDVDMVGVYDLPARGAVEAGGGLPEEHFARVMEGVRGDLSQHTEEGYAYRVDLRLRPYGRSGDLVHSVRGLQAYYEHSAALWEVQALLKMRPIAGNLDVGQRFLESVRPVVLRAWDREAVVRSIESMLDETRQNRPLGSSSLVDVKTDAGGLRSVEFLVQGLQLMHARKAPGLLTGNTLEALEVLEGAGLLPADVCRQLGEDYLFLRRVEHGLQLFEDRQVHAVPADRDELTALSRRILGVEATADAFIERLNACMGRVRDAYAHWLLAES